MITPSASPNLLFSALAHAGNEDQPSGSSDAFAWLRGQAQIDEVPIRPPAIGPHAGRQLAGLDPDRAARFTPGRRMLPGGLLSQLPDRGPARLGTHTPLSGSPNNRHGCGAESGCTGVTHDRGGPGLLPFQAIEQAAPLHPWQRRGGSIPRAAVELGALVAVSLELHRAESARRCAPPSRPPAAGCIAPDPTGTRPMAGGDGGRIWLEGDLMGCWDPIQDARS